VSTRPFIAERQRGWARRIGYYRARLGGVQPLQVEGLLSRMVGLTLEAVGCEAAVGGRCLVEAADGREIEAEVVGFSGERLFLMPTGDMRGLMPGASDRQPHSTTSPRTP